MSDLTHNEKREIYNAVNSNVIGVLEAILDGSAENPLEAIVALEEYVKPRAKLVYWLTTVKVTLDTIRRSIICGWKSETISECEYLIKHCKGA